MHVNEKYLLTSAFGADLLCQEERIGTHEERGQKMPADCFFVVVELFVFGYGAL